MRIVVLKCGSCYGVAENKFGNPFFDDDDIAELEADLSYDEEMRVIDVAALFESEVM